MVCSQELGEQAIARMLPLINASLSAVSKELSISYQTLYAWRAQSNKQPVLVTQAREAEDLCGRQLR